MTSAPSLTPTEAVALGWQAERRLCDRHFLRFLTHCKLRSDDPLAPTIAPWEPWPFLTERALAWESRQSEIDLKARQLGYSWLVAMYSVWRARAGAAVALISKGQLEARELLAKCAFVEQHLPKQLQAPVVPRTDDMKYRSGGLIMAFPSTPDAGVSFTFQLVIMDEGHFHAYAAANYAAIRPTLSAGGQFIALSTADPSLGPSGWFPDMYWASKRGETGYTAVFTPWSARPNRTAEWRARERAAFGGMAEEFDAFYPETDAEAFTGKSGLVFPMFSEAIHVKAVGDTLRGGTVIVPLEQCVRVVAGVDLGGGDPTVISILGMDSSHHVHKYAEFYRRGPIPVDALAEFLIQYPQLGAIECPPEQATVIATLSNPRTYNLPAHAANNKRGDGLNLYASVLTNETFTIDPSCKDSIAEFPGYRWAERVDPLDHTRYATKTPVDHHADGKDSERYALMEILAVMHSPGAQLARRSLTGRPLSKVLR